MKDESERKPFRVSLEDYKLLEQAKLKETKLYKEQAKRIREKQADHLKSQIVQKKRDIAFKKVELKTEVVEKHPDFVDGLKPKFFIENDIDELELYIGDCELQLEDLKRSEEEDK